MFEAYSVGIRLTPEAAARVARGETKESSFVRPGWRQQLGMTSDVHMDGEKVGRIVTKHQANAAGRPQTGLSGFDTSMGLAPFALSNLR